MKKPIKNFADALLDLIMAADEDEQQALRIAYIDLRAQSPRDVVPLFIRETLGEAFKLIDEAKAETAAALKIGDRVRTLIAKKELMVGIDIPAGVIGEIVKLETFKRTGLPCEIILGIKLDQHFDDLADWDNVLEFYIDEHEKIGAYAARIAPPAQQLPNGDVLLTDSVTGEQQVLSTGEC